MNKIKDEMIKSIKYIIPVIIAFIGIFMVKNFNEISNFITSNIYTIKDILSPFFIGFVIAYILNQPMKYLEKKFRIKRGISIALIYGAVVLIVLLSSIFIVPTIKSNVQDIYASIPQGINQIENMLNNISSSLKFDINNPDIKVQINDFIKNVLVPLSTTTANVVGDFVINFMSTFVSYTVNIVLGIVISVYLLLSKEKYIEGVNLLGHKIFKKSYLKIKEFVNILDKNIGVYIVAKSTDSTVYAILCTIILYLVKAKYALFLGIVAGITNMVPFFGPIIGTIVAVVINLFFSFDKALVVLVVMVVVQQIESAVLEPYFVGKQVGVPPIFTILAVTVASSYFGLIGILLSVPVISVILIYFKRFLYKDTRIDK